MPAINKIIDSKALIGTIEKTLQKIDPRLINHGERVAFMACELCEEAKLDIDEKTLFLLSIFHDIGAYKTDEIDRMVEFETENVNNHSIYGYLFLKYMSPLKKNSPAILYHHTSWNKIPQSLNDNKKYAALIHLCDRIDIAYLHKDNKKLFKSLTKTKQGLFCSEYVKIVLNSFENRKVFERLTDETYHAVNNKRLSRFRISEDEALEYLKMLVLAVDFRSEYTVTHTVNTVSIALDIADHFNQDQIKKNEIYLGALLHDVGKIAIPTEILENSGKLDEEQMRIMRTHVTETQKIISGVVPKNICNIAVRHHEKLDGSGYPYGLTGDELDFTQKIVAVADIISALVNKRSYKEPFSKERVISIIKSMSGTKLDENICSYICESYDEITDRTDNSRNEVIKKYQSMLREFEKLKITEL